MARLSDAVLDDLRARNPVYGIAARYVALRARPGGRYVGPCPICSADTASRSAGRFECTAEKWVCAVCCDGGDVIRLVQRVEGHGFREAVETLGGAGEADPADAARREADRAARREREARDEAERRERERGRCWDLWGRGAPIGMSSVAAEYLRLRRLEVPVEAPGSVALRSAADVPYFHPAPDGRSRIVHRGPAMLAAIQDEAGRFCGLHVTYINLDQSSGKAVIVDPDTGEVLPAKKVRGVKQAGAIRLVSPRAPRRMIMGEGIETSLSPWSAMLRAARDMDSLAVWSSVDLGNMGGRALETVPHPTARDTSGRPRRVPGLAPDMSVPGIAIPETVADIVLLGDGDSDRFLTDMTLRRAARRYAAPGRTVRRAWARGGMDFNDMLREGAA